MPGGAGRAGHQQGRTTPGHLLTIMTIVIILTIMTTVTILTILTIFIMTIFIMTSLHTHPVQDIRVKTLSLDIDSGKCLTARIKFPHNQRSDIK